jgi:hypothetical protein
MATMPGLARVAHGAMAMFPAAVLAAPADPALELEALERLLALGKESAFYLVLDADGPRLSLGLEGVVLRTYDAHSVEVGRGRLAWVAAATPAAAGRVLTGGALEPPRDLGRLEFTAPPPDPSREAGEIEVPVPPPVEEAIPVPARYRLRFADGSEVEFRSVGRSSPWEALSARLADALDALRHRGSSRLRVALGPEDHASLYRGVPPDVALIVLGGSRLGRPGSLRYDGSGPPEKAEESK